MSISKPSDSPNPQLQSQPTRKNYSLLSIPVTYALAFPPHLYFYARTMTAAGSLYTNVLPRTNLELLKGKITEATWSSLVRAAVPVGQPRRSRADS